MVTYHRPGPSFVLHGRVTVELFDAGAGPHPSDEPYALVFYRGHIRPGVPIRLGAVTRIELEDGDRCRDHRTAPDAGTVVDRPGAAGWALAS